MSKQVFIILSVNQISVNILDKKKIIYNKIFDVQNNLSNNIQLEDNLKNIIEEQIISIEKIINSTVNNINIILDDPNNLVIKISTKKNYDFKQIHKDQIEYLIQDLNQQVLSNNKDQRILHIIVENYIIDGNESHEIPLQKKCENLVIETKFICAKKNLINFLDRILKNYQIKLNSIICANYAFTLAEVDKSNLFEGILKVVDGENQHEVHMSPKKPTKLGFFEKIFHLFS